MENKNYAGIYAKRTEAPVEYFTQATRNSLSINETEKELSSLQKKIEDLNSKLNYLYATNYGEDFLSCVEKVCIHYRSVSDVDYYYSPLTGEIIQLDGKEDYPIQVNASKKNGIVNIPIGYSLDNASLIIVVYKYAITTDCTFIKLNTVDYALFDIFKNNTVASKTSTTLGCSRSAYSNTLNIINASDFLSAFYGTKINTSYNLCEITRYYRDNQAFEIFIRTAPENILDMGIATKWTESKPIYKLLEIDKETYDKAIELDILPEVYQLKDYVSHRDVFNKTPQEWLDLILKCKEAEADLDFYRINYTYGMAYYDTKTNKCPLLGNLASAYSSCAEFNKNYSFGKFVNYVIDETVNQGYTEIRQFLRELRDYISMCNIMNIKPTLYSSYLKQTHDIQSRNHKIYVSEEQEKALQNVYKDFKDTEIGDYVMTCPHSSEDIKKEGNSLNHCAYSYLKRVVDGTCRLLFLRLKEHKDESLITVEERNGAIVQVKGASNRRPTLEERKIIAKYAALKNLEYDITVW